MTNREFYKEQILDIACKGGTFGVNKETNTICRCSQMMDCKHCRFSAEEDCDIAVEEWCNSEYIESYPFEKGELVEVSDDGTDWRLRYFSHINNHSIFKYDTYPNGLKSGDRTTSWEYCRKYGTLGGLGKE